MLIIDVHIYIYVYIYICMYFVYIYIYIFIYTICIHACFGVIYIYIYMPYIYMGINIYPHIILSMFRSVPPRNECTKKLIEKTEQLCRRMRWKAYFFLNPGTLATQKNTYGFNSRKIGCFV